MKKLEINLKEFTSMSLEECNIVEGGSELSEAVFHAFGSVFGFIYRSAISAPIRPSEYR